MKKKILINGGCGYIGSSLDNYFSDKYEVITLDKRKNSPRYSNQAFTNGTWIGHGGYGGQFLLVNPDTGISVSFFSVLLNKTAMDYDYLGDMVSMMESVASDY